MPLCTGTEIDPGPNPVPDQSNGSRLRWENLHSSASSSYRYLAVSLIFHTRQAAGITPRTNGTTSIRCCFAFTRRPLTPTDSSFPLLKPTVEAGVPFADQVGTSTPSVGLMLSTAPGWTDGPTHQGGVESQIGTVRRRQMRVDPIEPFQHPQACPTGIGHRGTPDRN